MPPAYLPTNDPADCNLYALYAVDERACLRVLTSLPRWQGMATLLIDLEASETSSGVKNLAAGLGAVGGTAAVLGVVSTVTASPSFVDLPAAFDRDDGTRLTSYGPSECARLRSSQPPSIHSHL